MADARRGEFPDHLAIDADTHRVANDPHLALDTPATFYEIHLNVTGGINVTGLSFPGAPGIGDELVASSRHNAATKTTIRGD